MHQIASIDGSRKAAFRSDARSSSVPARYIVWRDAAGISFGTSPSVATTSSAMTFDSTSAAGLAGETSATRAPGASAFGRTGPAGGEAARAARGRARNAEAKAASARRLRRVLTGRFYAPLLDPDPSRPQNPKASHVQLSVRPLRLPGPPTSLSADP